MLDALRSSGSQGVGYLIWHSGGLDFQVHANIFSKAWYGAVTEGQGITWANTFNAVDNHYGGKWTMRGGDTFSMPPVPLATLRSSSS